MGHDQAIRTLFVTLRRSQAGKPWFHRRVLDGLGLKKRLTCVEKPNNPTIRGMLRKVRHFLPRWNMVKVLVYKRVARQACTMPHTRPWPTPAELGGSKARPAWRFRWHPMPTT